MNFNDIDLVFGVLEKWYFERLMLCLNIFCFYLDKKEMKFEIDEIFDLYFNNWLYLLI